MSFVSRRRPISFDGYSSDSSCGWHDYPEPYDDMFCDRKECENYETVADGKCDMCYYPCSYESCPFGLYDKGAHDLCSWCKRCQNKECLDYHPEATDYCMCCADGFCSREDCKQYKKEWEHLCVECMYPEPSISDYEDDDRYKKGYYDGYYDGYSGAHMCGGGTVLVVDAKLPDGYQDTFDRALAITKRLLRMLNIWVKPSAIVVTKELYTHGQYLVPGFYDRETATITISAYGLKSVDSAIQVLAHECVHAFFHRVGLCERATHSQNEGLCEVVSFQVYRDYLREKNRFVTYDDVAKLVKSSPDYCEYRIEMEKNILSLYSALLAKNLRKYFGRCMREKRIVLHSDPVRCYKCQRVGHVARNCRTRCYKCQRVGHVARNCRTKCYKCRRVGHVARNCRVK